MLVPSEGCRSSTLTPAQTEGKIRIVCKEGGKRKTGGQIIVQYCSRATSQWSVVQRRPLCLLSDTERHQILGPELISVSLEESKLPTGTF